MIDGRHHFKIQILVKLQCAIRLRFTDPSTPYPYHRHSPYVWLRFNDGYELDKNTSKHVQLLFTAALIYLVTSYMRCLRSYYVLKYIIIIKISVNHGKYCNFPKAILNDCEIVETTKKLWICCFLSESTHTYLTEGWDYVHLVILKMSMRRDMMAF